MPGIIEGRRYCLVLNRQVSCPLSFVEWLVYSYCYDKKKPLTQSYVAESLNIHPNTITRARKVLTAHNMLERKTRKLVVKPPPEKYFFERKDGKLAYWVHHLPDEENCPFTNQDNAIYWYLYSLTKSGKRASIKGIALKLKISRPTVRKAIEMLKSMQLLQEGRIVDIPPPAFYKQSKPPKIKRTVYNTLQTIEEKTTFLVKAFWDVYGFRLEKLRKPKWEGATSVDPEGRVPPYTFDIKRETGEAIQFFTKLAVDYQFPLEEIIKAFGWFVKFGEHYKGWEPIRRIANDAGNILKLVWLKTANHYDGKERYKAVVPWFFKEYNKTVYNIKTHHKINLSDWD